MESLVKDFIEKVDAEEFETENFGGSLADLNQNGAKKALAPLVDMISTAVQSDQLAQATLSLTDADIQVRLETSVVNLPLRYVNAMKKMLADDETLPVSVYSIVESPDVNASSLRIDKVASADDFVSHQADMASAIATWLDTQLEQIKTNQEKQADEETAPDDSDVNDK
ncbi:hypothetical protein FD04_GL000599 [Secundilactobacillus odoratitofui DSM 19909 = JCM 15043]|uniref:Uncharacterized protein n=1 Tax=Secundilactobacillus odoratitofui DSM 19909 = JCM 15043 TaxID=1423776 RepID=A0A0R1M1A6_9LACO|nr:hypothetical protein [Secundilactobacillus odoratitofui]KRK98857.1 hypothetical protein FD04_GL000599 [Secundilactobacillus odoratitofui DSM 19909 = JCM 15043]